MGEIAWFRQKKNILCKISPLPIHGPLPPTSSFFATEEICSKGFFSPWEYFLPHCNILAKRLTVIIERVNNQEGDSSIVSCKKYPRQTKICIFWKSIFKIFFLANATYPNQLGKPQKIGGGGKGRWQISDGQ